MQSRTFVSWGLPATLIISLSKAAHAEEPPAAAAPPAAAPASAPTTETAGEDALAAPVGAEDTLGKKKKKHKAHPADVAEVSGEAAAQANASIDEEPEVVDAKPTKKKKKAKDRFEIKGRIIARSEFASREQDIVGRDLTVSRETLETHDLSLQSARVGFRYDVPIPGISAVLSAEFRGKPKVKDAYVQYKGESFGARVGQFKVPGSPFENDSRLSLPTADRGFIHDIFTDRLELGDRRPGLLGSYDTHGTALRFKLSLGVFQGSYLEDASTRDTSLIEVRAKGAQNLVARAEVSFGGLELGATGNYRVGTNKILSNDEEPNHFWAAGLDARFDHWFGGTGLRAWADVNTGESWFVTAGRSASDRPRFSALRSMAAFRIGGEVRGDRYLELYAMGGGFDPDSDVSHDLAVEAALGINAGLWDRGRLSLQGGLQHTQRNFPADFVYPELEDRKSVIAQVGVSL